MKPEAKKAFNAVIAQLKSEGIDLTVNCGDRSVKHNKDVGGAPDSQHLHGTAMDFSIACLTETARKRVIQLFMEQGALGFGIYRHDNGSITALHVDFGHKEFTVWGEGGSFHQKRNKDGSVNYDWLPDWAKEAFNTPRLDNPNKQNNDIAQTQIQNQTQNLSNFDQKELENNPILALVVAVLSAIFPKGTGGTQDVNNANLGNLALQNGPTSNTTQQHTHS